MLVQLIQGGSGTLRTEYPALITLVAAFFFPVGLVNSLQHYKYLSLDEEMGWLELDLPSPYGPRALHSKLQLVPLWLLPPLFYPDRREQIVIFAMTSIKRRTKLWELPVNWIIVFFGNLCGSLSYVAFMGSSFPFFSFSSHNKQYVKTYAWHRFIQPRFRQLAWANVNLQPTTRDYTAPQHSSPIPKPSLYLKLLRHSANASFAESVAIS